MMALVGAIEVTSLSGAAGAGDPAVVDSLVAAWMQSSKVQARDSSKGDAKAAASGAKVSAKVGGTPKPRKSVTANSAEGALGPQSGADADGAVLSSPRSGAADKGHVVLLLPLCLDLVLSSCNAPELKAVAVALIKYAHDTCSCSCKSLRYCYAQRLTSVLFTLQIGGPGAAEQQRAGPQQRGRAAQSPEPEARA